MRHHAPWLAAVFLVGGCATASAPIVKPVETTAGQVDAARKVAGGIAGREVSEKELRRITADVRSDEGARTAVEAITGTAPTERPVVKYSPVTGKHYSGTLDYEPGTGVRLEPLPE